MAMSAVREGRVATIRIAGKALENPALETLLAQIEQLLKEEKAARGKPAGQCHQARCCEAGGKAAELVADPR